ncbi:MAG: hypothetical protein JWN86_1976 [Planctomycetota bacterium]|nr:hypothetical protein [Planctomycetota bacterium]
MRGWCILAIALAPAVLAVWMAPVFVTQDGPAHLYNAHILNESLRANSPFRGVFQVNWSPLPNWSGHLLLMGLLSLVSPRAADRLATTIPLIGFAASAFWLRRRVAGRRGELTAAVVSALLALNVAWLLGFTSFLLGACLFPVTLGLWWIGRHRVNGKWALGLASLIVLGYFAHLVSLGLTVVGLGLLAMATPGRSRARIGWTAAGLLPLLVLGPVYRILMGRGGPIVPVWGHLRRTPWAIASWREQLGWVDPLSLGRKVVVPFLPGQTAWLGIVTPAALVALAVVILITTTWTRRDRNLRGWGILAAVLLVGGLVTPDTLGASHGNYLPQRVALLGLVALLAWVDLDLSRWPGKVATGLLLAALMLQSLTVWDYAFESSDRVGPFARSREHVGKEARVGTLLIGIRGRFRANPVLHADNLLGIGTGNIVWADYETVHYYFPVQFSPDVRRPPAHTFEAIANMDDPNDAAGRAKLWDDLLAAHHTEIDILVVWGRDPVLDEISAKWFAANPFREDGPLRLFRHR